MEQSSSSWEELEVSKAYWWQYKLKQPNLEEFGSFPKKLTIESSYSTSEIYSQKWKHMSTQSLSTDNLNSFICNGQKLEATQMSIKWMNKQIVMWPYNDTTTQQQKWTIDK